MTQAFDEVAAQNRNLPTCPYCARELTLADVGSINVALRTDRLLNRAKRRKPRVREVLPVLFSFMKDGEVHRSRDLFRNVTDTLAEQGFEEKRLATNFALTWLAREGVVKKVRHGFWQMTLNGKHEEMTAERAADIERRHDPALNRKLPQLSDFA